MEQSNTGRIAPWVEEEMATAQLEDKRLNARPGRLLSDLGDRPAAGIPAACGGYKEMTAAYRFFDNPKGTYARVLAPHQASTRRRMAAQPVVLLVQDTTEMNLTRPQQQVEGAGPLDGGARRGVFVHAMEAFGVDGTPLGVMIRLVAQLGGYVNRPDRVDPPGPQTLWPGLQRTHDLAWAWNTFGPAATEGRKDM